MLKMNGFWGFGGSVPSAGGPLLSIETPLSAFYFCRGVCDVYFILFFTAQPAAIFKAQKNETRQPVSCILLTGPAFYRLNFVTQRQNSVSLSQLRYDALLSATAMFALLTHHLAAVSIRGKACMYLFAPLAEELVCVCVFQSEERRVSPSSEFFLLSYSSLRTHPPGQRVILNCLEN